MDNNSRIPDRLAHVWRQFMPFWLFRDAGRGTIEQRIANYRYNRRQRGILPSFIFKWITIAAGLILALQILSSLMRYTLEGSVINVYMALLCATAGIAFAFSCVVITILTVCYVFLSRPDY